MNALEKRVRGWIASGAVVTIMRDAPHVNVHGGSDSETAMGLEIRVVMPDGTKTEYAT